MAHPHNVNTEVSLNEKIAWEVFEAYAKTVIRNYGRNLQRGLLRRHRKETVEADPAYIVTWTDHYPCEDYCLVVGSCVYHIHHEAIYEGLMLLPKCKMEAVILHYWELKTDIELGQHFGVTDRTIRKWRQQSIEEMRKFVNGGGCRTNENRTKQEDCYITRRYPGR